MPDTRRRMWAITPNLHEPPAAEAIKLIHCPMKGGTRPPGGSPLDVAKKTRRKTRSTSHTGLNPWVSGVRTNEGQSTFPGNSAGNQPNQ